ncbi:unnamed protein product [Arctia plantaginis]|uniref:EGF-like domain-containing protein n=1 Tax=Arctia plantaginis TaxID=874455 RepID=A0A8S0YSY4_ARCPL|nr:unnamed protein product [Arctia plantaginis]CAB3241334.1 unnamed protein product [Arctia plantaginis]
MKIKTFDVLATLLLNLIQYGCSEHILSCNVSIYGTCPALQTCNETTSKCDCLRGFIRIGDDCEKPDSNVTSYSGATIATVTIFTLALLIAGAVLVIRKYNLIEYVQQKIRSRRNNDVMYEDVMIGNDDPPLSP